jgi:hypothetical protein
MFLPEYLKKNGGAGGEKGSITIMVAFLLPVMLLMLMMIVNINQLVFTKIKLQNTVDACALSAAAVQAAGLNEIADLNGEMAYESAKAQWFLSSGTWHNFSFAVSARNFFYNSKSGVLDHIRRYQKEANAYFAAKAEAIAEDVRRRNFPESFLTARHDTRRLTALKEKYTKVPFTFYTASYTKGSPKITKRWSYPDNPRYADNHDGRRWKNAKRTLPISSKFSMLEKVRKNSSTYVDYELALPPHAFIAADALFGGMPELRARAAARPAGGHIFRGEPTYGAVLEK